MYLPASKVFTAVGTNAADCCPGPVEVAAFSACVRAVCERVFRITVIFYPYGVAQSAKQLRTRGHIKTINFRGFFNVRKHNKKYLTRRLRL